MNGVRSRTRVESRRARGGEVDDVVMRAQFRAEPFIFPFGRRSRLLAAARARRRFPDRSDWEVAAL